MAAEEIKEDESIFTVKRLEEDHNNEILSNIKLQEIGETTEDDLKEGKHKRNSYSQRPIRYFFSSNVQLQAEVSQPQRKKRTRAQLEADNAGHSQ